MRVVAILSVEWAQLLRELRKPADTGAIGLGAARRIVVCTRKIGIASLLGILAFAVPVHAQGFIVPYIGWDFGGNASCASPVNCQGKRTTFGASLGSLGRSGGFETDFTYAKDFFGTVPGVDNSVFTWMNNYLIGGGGGSRIQPYAVIGLGLMTANISSNPVAGVYQSVTTHSLGWDVGVAVQGYFTRSVGIRGDIRHFQSFVDMPVLGLIGEEKLDYWRGTVGVAFRF